jgi:hypothetical protein
LNASIKARLEREYRDMRSKIYDSDLSWEKKCLKVHRLRLETDRKIRQAEKEEGAA